MQMCRVLWKFGRFPDYLGRFEEMIHCNLESQSTSLGNLLEMQLSWMYIDVWESLLWTVRTHLRIRKKSSIGEQEEQCCNGGWVKAWIRSCRILQILCMCVCEGMYMGSWGRDSYSQCTGKSLIEFFEEEWPYQICYKIHSSQLDFLVAFCTVAQFPKTL